MGHFLEQIQFGGRHQDLKRKCTSVSYTSEDGRTSVHSQTCGPLRAYTITAGQSLATGQHCERIGAVIPDCVGVNKFRKVFSPPLHPPGFKRRVEWER